MRAKIGRCKCIYTRVVGLHVHSDVFLADWLMASLTRLGDEAFQVDVDVVRILNYNEEIVSSARQCHFALSTSQVKC